jgi:hypothetical protein
MKTFKQANSKDIRLEQRSHKGNSEDGNGELYRKITPEIEGFPAANKYIVNCSGKR